MDLKRVKYKKRYPSEKIIFVSPTKLLDRLEKDDPEFNVRNPKYQLGNRVGRAKEFILKNWDNPKAVFEPSIVSINYFNSTGELRLSFGDGRHRVLAAEELGISEVAIEIKPSQEKYFDYMKVKSMNESTNQSITKISNNFMKLFDLFIKSEEKLGYRNKWIYIDGFKMYVRKSKRFYNKEFIDFIDLATIESDNQGTGLFTLILKEILDKYKDRNFYVENVMTDRFLNFFKKFGFIDYPLYDRCLIKISDQKMNESPDYIDKYKNFYQNSDALPIIAWLNEDGVYVGIGEYGCSHSSVKKPSNLGFKYSIEYSGRLFTYNKVMSFWTYPDKEIFIKIINKLEKKLKKKLWNNDWKIEILLVDNKIPIDLPYNGMSEYDKDTSKYEIIPIEDYLKSEDIPDELRKIHLMSWAEKDSLRKAGKDPLKYYKSLGKEKPLAYKQAIYQENTSYEDVVSKFKKDILYPLKREALKFDNFKDFSTSYSVYGNHGLYFHLTDNPNWKYNSEIGSRDMSSMADGYSQKGSFMVTSDMEGWDYYYNFDDEDKPRTSHTRDYVALIDLGDVKYHIGFGRGFGHEIYIYPNEAKKAILLDVLPIEESRIFYKKWREIMPESEKALLKLWKEAHKTTEKMITKFQDFENNI